MLDRRRALATLDGLDKNNRLEVAKIVDESSPLSKCSIVLCEQI